MGVRATEKYSMGRTRIGFMSGNPQLTAVHMVVMSLYDADIQLDWYSTPARTGTPVWSGTITASAGAGLQKLAKYCDDRATSTETIEYPAGPDDRGETWVCWVGSIEATGLSAGTRYYGKLTQVQGADTIVERDVSTCTAPNAGTDFRVFGMSCDDAERYGWPTGGGAWRFIKYDILANYDKPRYMLYFDDLGYADGLRHNQYAGTPQGRIEDVETGKRQTNRACFDINTYNYGLHYALLFGLIGGDESVSSFLGWGADRCRRFGVRNMPWLLQFGDHEFINDCGLTSMLSSYGPNTYPTGEPANVPSLEQPMYARGRAAWDALFAPLNPSVSIQSADTDSNHWAATLGDLRIVCPELITQGMGPSLGDPIARARILGAGQIEDCLTAIDTDEPFKLWIITGYDLHHFGDQEEMGSRSAAIVYGTHFPLEFACRSEYLRLLFAEGEDPPSLMENPRTNGTNGVLMFWHGDAHTPWVQQFDGYQDRGGSSGLRGRWVEITCAPGAQELLTVGGLPAQRIQAGANFFGNLPLHVHPDMCQDGNTKDPIGAVAVLDIIGTATPKEARNGLAYGYEQDCRIRWQRTFKVGSNLPA